jgi:hypothetical protein
MKRCASPDHQGPNLLPETEFYRDTASPDGLTYCCKGCSRQKSRRWREKNPEKELENKRRWRAAHPEKAGEYQKSWREAHPDKSRELDRSYRAANQEKIRESKRRYYAAYPEMFREASRRYRAAHPEEVKEATNRRQARDNAVTRDSARHHREVWTGPQLEIAAREDLTAKQVAAMTGRTVYAVYNIRRRLRDDPKIIWLAGLDDPADAMARPGASFGPVADELVTA